jgi:hypothetical protein
MKIEVYISRVLRSIAVVGGKQRAFASPTAFHQSASTALVDDSELGLVELLNTSRSSTFASSSVSSRCSISCAPPSKRFKRFKRIVEGTEARLLRIRVRDSSSPRQKCRDADYYPLIASSVDV